MKSRDERHRNSWNELGHTDPLWAVLSDPAKRGGHWDLGEFLATGEADIASLMTIANRLGHPQRRSNALDFGAGVGRLSIALGSRFETVTGLDVSISMIELAKSSARDLATVTFEVADRDSLAKLPAGSFDLVVSMWVLQHLATKDDIRGALRELARLLGVAGLLAVQVPGDGGGVHIGSSG
jgi:ubiquinone/menaquinone biosynthesis C-methylase UbiE